MADEFVVSIKGPGVDLSKTVEAPVVLQFLHLIWGAPVGGAVQPAPSAFASPAAGIASSQPSIGEFIAGLQAQSNPEKIAACALYLQEYESGRRLRKDEVPQLFTLAGEAPPKNPSRDLQLAVERRLIAEDPAKRGEFFVTQTGSALLRGTTGNNGVRSAPTSRRRSRKARRTQEGNDESASERGGTRTRRSSEGPKTQLRRLIEEDWFATPRTTAEMLKELAERSFHYPDSSLTAPLQAFVKDQVLRRKKSVPAGGKKEVWHYSNW